MVRCVYCGKETSRYKIIEAMGRIVVCDDCMKGKNEKPDRGRQKQSE